MEEFMNEIRFVIKTEISTMKTDIINELKSGFHRSTIPPSSVGDSSESDSAVSVLSCESTHVSKRRLCYENEEFKNRNAPDIDIYLQKLMIPNNTTHLVQYSTLLRAANVRLLSYEEFISVEDIVNKFKKKRPKKGKGVTGISDDPYRTELLTFVSAFHEAVFDPKYISIHMYHLTKNYINNSILCPEILNVLEEIRQTMRAYLKLRAAKCYHIFMVARMLIIQLSTEQLR